MSRKFINLVKVAARLKSEGNENPEYDRALVEMACDASSLGLTSDDHPTVEKIISATQVSETFAKELSELVSAARWVLKIEKPTRTEADVLSELVVASRIPFNLDDIDTLAKIVGA